MIQKIKVTHFKIAFFTGKAFLRQMCNKCLLKFCFVLYLYLHSLQLNITRSSLCMSTWFCNALIVVYFLSHIMQKYGLFTSWNCKWLLSSSCKKCCNKFYKEGWWDLIDYNYYTYKILLPFILNIIWDSILCASFDDIQIHNCIQITCHNYCIEMVTLLSDLLNNVSHSYYCFISLSVFSLLIQIMMFTKTLITIFRVKWIFTYMHYLVSL